jgi:hypothetical protein
MSKNTQAYILFNMLKAAGDKGVNKEQVAKALNVKESSVPVYFFGMKKLYKVIKNGRQVVAYKLNNPNEVTGVPQTRGAGKIKAKPVKATAKAVVTKPVKVAKIKSSNFDVPTLEQDNDVPHISDREFNDIKTSLGIM